MTVWPPVITKLFSARRAKSVKPSDQAALLIGDEGCRVAFLDKRRNMRTIFAPDTQEGRTLIRDWLDAASIKRVRIVSDQSVQSYSREDIPKATKRDRENILKRRLIARFGDQTLTTFSAIESHATASNVQAQSYLLAGITDDSSVRLWLRDLAEDQIEVTSIGLLPLEWADILPALLAQGSASAEARTWQVVVTRQRTGGIRHVVLKGNQLILTRLTTQPPGMIKTASNAADGTATRQRWQDELIGEIQASIGYIKRFGYTADQKLVINLIGGSAFADMVAVQQAGQAQGIVSHSNQQVQTGHGPVWRAHRIRDWLSELQIKTNPEAHDNLDDLACALLATLFSTRSPRQPLTSPFWRELGQQRQQRQLVRGAIVATILGLCGWSGWSAVQWQSALDVANGLETELSDLRSRHAQLLQQSADLPPDLSISRDFMRAYAQTHGFEQDLRAQHDAILTSLPDDLRLKMLLWQTGQAEAAHAESADFEVEASHDLSVSQADHHTMTVELEFDFIRAMNPEQAAEMGEQFLEQLRYEMPSHQIDVLHSEVPYAVAAVTAGSWSANAPTEDTAQPLAGKMILQVQKP